jgi:hypothetical protein
MSKTDGQDAHGHGDAGVPVSLNLSFNMVMAVDTFTLTNVAITRCPSQPLPMQSTTGPQSETPEPSRYADDKTLSEISSDVDTGDGYVEDVDVGKAGEGSEGYEGGDEDEDNKRHGEKANRWVVANLGKGRIIFINRTKLKEPRVYNNVRANKPFPLYVVPLRNKSKGWARKLTVRESAAASLSTKRARHH